MNLLPARVPAIALYDFTELFVPLDTPEGSTVELRITISDSNLSVRDFGAYLSMADRVYGRVTEAGLRSYSQTPYKQLRISEIRKGSIEAVIVQAISHFKDATPLAILWLYLKYLPNAVKLFSEVVKNTADAYKSYEDGRLTRENRKNIREELKHDEALAKLDPNRINQIAALLEDLQAKESNYLAGPIRFAQEEVESVELVVVKKEE